MENQTEHTV